MGHMIIIMIKWPLPCLPLPCLPLPLKFIILGFLRRNEICLSIQIFITHNRAKMIWFRVIFCFHFMLAANLDIAMHNTDQFFR